MSITRLDEADFLAALLALLPQGAAWPREPDAVATRYLSALASRAAVLHARIGVLSELESFPSSTSELLLDWEHAFGLPDECGVAADFVEARRGAITAKLTDQASPTVARFIAMAARYGATVTVYEHQAYTCEMDCELPVNDETWRFAWTINGPGDVISEATCEDNCEVPLRAWQTGAYECAIRRDAPAHTVPIFTYGS